jgi:MFS family permease
MNTKRSPFAHPNVKLFVAFRLFFNSRFYYPVFSILFLDFGLTLSQFAILNSVWAATIVICEVPSGALADIVGRKNLLVFSGFLMVAEMALLAFAPGGDADLLFLFFLANRILSGMAEASASGADEALAYDTLVRDGNVRDWGIVLEKQMLVRSVGFIVSMILGAAVYDPELMQKASDFLGLGMTFDKNVTLRLPLYLTLVLAICALGSSILMEEIRPDDCEETAGCSKSVLEAFKLTFRAGRWILTTPFVLAVMLTGLVFDSFSRMLITMGSQYYRIIEIPEAMFGFIGSALAVGGIFIPRIARRLA